jgi:hypothetical protein
MKLPFPAGNTLNDNTRILVNKYAHFSASNRHLSQAFL